MAERWLSVEEIAARLGVDRDTIYKWIVARAQGRATLEVLTSEIDAGVKKGTAGQKETLRSHPDATHF